MKLPVMTYILGVIGLIAIVVGFFYGSLQPLESIEGKIEKTSMTKMKISSTSSSRMNGSTRRTSMEPVLAISTDGESFFVREIYKEFWKELQEKTLIGKTISVTYEKNSYMIKELTIDGKTIINDEVANEGNNTFRYFFFAFGAMAFYMAWQFYNKKKVKSQGT